MTHILENAKAYVALVTAAAAALLTEYGPDDRLGQVLTVVVILGGVFTTWRVPNADAHAGPAGLKDEDGQSTAVTVLVVIALLLLIVFLWQVLVVKA